MPYEWGRDPVSDTFGEEGEQALRRATQKHGFSRGKTLHERHLAAGIPINVKNLFEHGDLPKGKGGGAGSNRIQLDEDNCVSEVIDCYLQQIWEELGGEEEGNRIGAIYCDEFHWAMYSTYDKDITTELPQLLTKHDPCCYFEVHRRESSKDNGG